MYWIAHQNLGPYYINGNRFSSLLIVFKKWFVYSLCHTVEEEEVDKMMEQKMKEEEERKRTKEIEERMSLEETKEQVCTATISSLWGSGSIILKKNSFQAL